MHRRHALRVLAAAATPFVAPVRARAADVYPTTTIRLEHGFGSGGNVDTLARIIAPPMSASLGQSIVVEPKPGAGGTIASNDIAKARPDGYSLILLTGGHAVAAALYRTLPYDSVNDFAMISTVATFPFVLSVRANSPYRTLAQLLAAARAKPDTITYSTVGVGSTVHLAGLLLASMANVKMKDIPYKNGGTAALTGVLSGETDLFIDSLTVSGPQIAGGALHPLGVTSLRRWPTLPQVPPVAATLPGYDVTSWNVLATTKGVPNEIVAKLNGALRHALTLPEVRQRAAALGVLLGASSPAEARALVARDVARWQKVVRDAHIEQR